MKKDQLKKILKPLIKECIKEVIFEEGILSGLIKEVAVGLGTQHSIVEASIPYQHKIFLDSVSNFKQKQEQLWKKKED